MENAAKFLSVTAAAAFVCSVAFQFGEAIGYGQARLLAYYSFSDFVDAAPVISASLIMYIGWSLWNDEKRRIANNYVRKKVEVPLLAAALMLAAWSATAGVLYLVINATIAATVWCLGLITYVLYIQVLPAFRRPETDRLIDLIERGTWAVMLTLLVGVSWGTSKHLGHYTIQTEQSTITATNVIELERGVAILDTNGFNLLPWERVKSVSYSSTPGDGPGK